MINTFMLYHLQQPYDHLKDVLQTARYNDKLYKHETLEHLDIYITEGRDEDPNSSNPYLFGTSESVVFTYSVLGNEKLI